MCLLWLKCLAKPMIALRKWMILIHRYLGIAVCLLFVMWFVSGIAMIFARGMPSLTPGLRSERLAELNLAAVKLTPSEAAEKAQLDRAPARAGPFRCEIGRIGRHPIERDLITGEEPAQIAACVIPAMTEDCHARLRRFLRNLL